MQASGVHYSQEASAYAVKQNAGARVEKEKAAEQTAEKEQAAVFEKSAGSVDYDKIGEMKLDLRSHQQNLQNLVSKLLLKQGAYASSSLADLNSLFELGRGGNLKAALSGVQADEATRAQAQSMIAEDGYFGVEQTSARILDFAKALSGGDPSKIATLREAVEKGFRQAAGMWGAELPDISQKTYDKIMAGFDEWEKSAIDA